MANNVEVAIKEIIKLIDSLVDPKIMTLDEYDDFLDTLESEIETRIDCRREEKENEEEDACLDGD